MSRMIKILAALLAVCLLATGCGGSSHSNGQKADAATQQDNFNHLQSKDPAHKMDSSPTRKTINRWIDTWGKDPKKLAYVYMQNTAGELIGYYVFQGLPVSMCTALTPPYKIVQDENDNGQMSVPAPGMDGVWYSGGECNRYYGFDAVTGAYVDFTVGMGNNLLMYDQPLTNHPNVANLAPPKK